MAEKNGKLEGPGIIRPRLHEAYRQAMGVPDGRVGPLCSATPAQLLARVVLPSHPVDALHAVHQDAMAITRLMVADDGSLDAEDRRDAACALWRTMDRLEVTIELLERAATGA